MTHRDMPLADLVAHLRHAGSVWFKNYDLLLLEELIRRAQRTAGATPGDDNDRRYRTCPICGGRIPDVPGHAAGGFGGRALTDEEIAQIEAWGRGAYASLVHEGEDSAGSEA